MEAIRIEFKSGIKSKILELLSSFSSDELKIVQEDANFEKNKRQLDIALAKIENGTAECCSLEELDSFLEEAISKYEN